MRRSPALTATTAILAATATVVALSGCSGFPLPGLSGGCEPAYQSGAASDLVSVAGEFADDPEASFPTPLIAPTPEVTVAIEGEGDPLPVGGATRIAFTVYNGEDLETIVPTQRGLLIAGPKSASFTRSLECATAGSRIVLVTSAADASPGEPDPGTPDIYYVVVIDVLETWLGKANGINQLPVDGMPTVATAVDGQPGVVLPGEAAPTEARYSTIKAGGGATLAEGDVAVLHIRSWSWPLTIGARPVVDVDTWAQAPQLTSVSDDNDYGPLFAEALRGARVGSQLLMVLPPGAGGGTATVYVVDVLGTSDPVYTGVSQ